jgi:hypothetical protein
VHGLLLFGNRDGTTVRAATYGIVAGMSFGVSATLMKPVVEAMHTDGWGVLTGWQLSALAATGIVGFLLQQISLATGRLVTSVASVSVANPIVSVMLGAVVLEERLARPAWHVLVAICALAVALFGVIVITSAREAAEEPTVRVPRACGHRRPHGAPPTSRRGDRQRNQHARAARTHVAAS